MSQEIWEQAEIITWSQLLLESYNQGYFRHLFSLLLFYQTYPTI